MKKFNGFLLLTAALAIIAGCSKKEDDKLSISLSQTTNYDFPAATGSDYEAKTPLTVTITNTGNVVTGKLSIAIDGAAADKFNLSKSSIDNIAVGGSDTFTVVPIMGLAEGDYQATVYVSCKGAPEQKFGVRFVVTKLDITSIVITSPPVKVLYGVGESIDLTGLVVTATGSDGNSFVLEDIEDYLVYDFSVPSVKDEETGDITKTKVQIVVGAAPVKEFEVTVQTLGDRIDAVKGTTATIVIYGDEFTDGEITINAANTNLTLTTPEGSTAERVLKKSITSYFMTINGGAENIKVTLDGYVTIKGWASETYGGSDETSNNNVLIRLQSGAVLEMKGHSKITGNVVDRSASSSNWVDGAAVKISGSTWIISENAQVTNNGFVGGTGVTYGGACYFTGASTVVRIKDNAKISGNFVQSGGNCLGGFIGGEEGTLYMEGGEVSGNYSKSTGGVASGGAFCLVNGTVKSILSGGVIKNNYTLFALSSRGSAILAGNAQAVRLTGDIQIPAGSTDYTTEGDLKKDSGNAISMVVYGTSATSVYSINIGDALTTSSKIMLDMNYNGDSTPGLSDLNANTRIMRKYAIVNEAESITDFDGDAPADKFTLRNYLNWRASTVTSLSGKSINANGYMTTP